MKFSKLALMPLLALLLASCTTNSPASSGSGEQTESSQTETQTQTETGPSWTEAEQTMMKQVLNGNTLPYFHYEGGAFEVGQNEEGFKTLEYTIVSPSDSAKTELITLFEADGYIFNENASTENSAVYNKLLEKFYLSEQIIMEISSMRGPKGPVLGLSWFYLADEVQPEWPTADVEELMIALDYAAGLPAPSFKFTHFTVMDYDAKTGDIVFALFTGDFTSAYLKDLLLNGYTAKGAQLEDGTPVFNVINDLYKHNVMLFYDAEVQATIIYVSYEPTTHWYNRAMAKQIEKAMDIAGLYLPEPSFEYFDYLMMPLPIDENDPTAGFEFAIALFTDNVKAPQIYVDDMMLYGGFTTLETPAKPGDPWVLMDGRTKAVVIVSSYLDDLGGILIEVIGTGKKPTAEEATGYSQLITDVTALAFGEQAVLPLLPTENLYAAGFTIFEETVFVRAIYTEAMAAAKAYVALFTSELGWTLRGDLETDESIILSNKSTNLVVTLLVDAENDAIIFGIKNLPAATTWKEALTEAEYAALTGSFGENVEEHLPFPPFKETYQLLEVADSGDHYATIVYANANASEKMTVEDYKAYCAALIAAGWAYDEAEDMYSKTINGYNFGLQVAFDGDLFLLGFEGTPVPPTDPATAA